MRPLPWTELVEAIGEERLGDIRTGLEADGVDQLDRDAFLLHRSAGAVLRELVPEGGDPEAVNAYGTLLHMIYLMWLHGWPVVSPSDHPTIRRSVYYLQLAPRAYWADNEPIDGLFVLEARGRMQALAVLGLNELRTGFTTMEAEAPLPLQQPAARDDGSAPFASVLPGGELAGLKSIVNAGELLWLTHG